MSIRRTPTLSTPDEAAMAWPCTLLDRHRAGVYSHALHLLGRREDTADAVQQTFVLALARLNQLHDADAAGAWLHAILRSVCLMQVRRPRARDRHG